MVLLLLLSKIVHYNIVDFQNVVFDGRNYGLHASNKGDVQIHRKQNIRRGTKINTGAINAGQAYA
ncbi:MAG TPA: hypothetical protein VGE04_09565, partial [Chloroflexia bacterium]